MNKQVEQKYFHSRITAAIFLASSVGGCHTKSQKSDKSEIQKTDSVGMGDKLNCCSSGLPSRPFMQAGDTIQNKIGSNNESTHEGMIFIPGGSFVMGGDSIWGRPDEFPLHEVKVSSFLWVRTR